MATDIFLRAGESSPADVKLRDTTVADAAGDPTGTLAWTESGDTWALTGNALVSGTIAWTQGADTWALTGSVTASGALSWTQESDTWAATGSATVSGPAAWTQAGDAWALAGSVTAAVAEAPAEYGGSVPGFNLGGRGRSGEGLRKERERLGIIPARVEKVIEKVLQQQPSTEAVAVNALHRELVRARLDYQARYAAALRLELARQQVEREDEEVVALLMLH